MPPDPLKLTLFTVPALVAVLLYVLVMAAVSTLVTAVL
jgi:hypothetical protein